MPKSRLISPSYFKVLDRSSIPLANIQQPVKDIIVVLCIQSDLVCLVKDLDSFVVDCFACP